MCNKIENKVFYKNAVVVDFGVNSGAIYYGETGKSEENISHEEILEKLENLPKGTVIVGEVAHLGTPRKESRAQPYTDQELLDFYYKCNQKGLIVKLFQHSQTQKARNHANLSKADKDNIGSDLRDAKAIHKWLLYSNLVLKNPPKSFTIRTKIKESWLLKKIYNKELNEMRLFQYENTGIYKFLQKHMKTILANADKTTISAFKLDSKYLKGNKKAGYKKGDFNFSKIKMKQLCSILITLMDFQGNPREKLPSWRFAKENLYQMKPSHFKGGVLRSNLYFHGMRNWIPYQMEDALGKPYKYYKEKKKGGFFGKSGKKKKGSSFTSKEVEKFNEFRNAYCKAIKDIFIICKKIIEKEQKN